MLGSSLSGIIFSLQNEAAEVVPDEDGIPTFAFKSDLSTALGWLRRLVSADGEESPFPVEAALEALGVRIHYEEMERDAELSGYIELRANGWHVGVNKFEVPGRQRFTLAHELGHLLFHKKMLTAKGRLDEAIKLFRSEENTTHLEMEANCFAAEILMPTKSFRRQWSTSSLPDVAEVFAVSRYAAEYRARKLSLPEKK